MQDVIVPSFDFSATEISFKAVSDSAKALFSEMFGAGATEVSIPKSRGIDFEVFLDRKGLKVGR